MQQLMGQYSHPRDEGATGSDVNLLMSFDDAATTHRYFSVQFHEGGCAIAR